MAIFYIKSLIFPDKVYDRPYEFLANHVNYENLLIFETTRNFYDMIYNKEMDYGKATLTPDGKGVSMYINFSSNESYNKFVSLCEPMLNATDASKTPFKMEIKSDKLVSQAPDNTWFKILSPDAEIESVIRTGGVGNNYFFLEFPDE